MANPLDKTEALKGITTQEGMDMAKKKDQMDRSKADINGDGEVSKYEETRNDAVQAAMADDPEQDEKGMACGGMMEMPEEYDPVSGNPIPPGVSASNVRDDIPAWLSEGEYVLPADVVKWHGLKHIMEMQDEAKMGLMMMTDMGLIVEADNEDYEEQETCDNCPENGCEDCPFAESEEDEEVAVEETPEGNEVEYPTVETVEEFIEDDTSDEYDEEEEYATEETTSSMFGVVKKPKVTFIV